MSKFSTSRTNTGTGRLSSSLIGGAGCLPRSQLPASSWPRSYHRDAGSPSSARSCGVGVVSYERANHRSSVSRRFNAPSRSSYAPCRSRCRCGRPFCRPGVLSLRWASGFWRHAAHAVRRLAVACACIPAGCPGHSLSVMAQARSGDPDCCCSRLPHNVGGARSSRLWALQRLRIAAGGGDGGLGFVHSRARGLVKALAAFRAAIMRFGRVQGPFVTLAWWRGDRPGNLQAPQST